MRGRIPAREAAEVYARVEEQVHEKEWPRMCDNSVRAGLLVRTRPKSAAVAGGNRAGVSETGDDCVWRSGGAHCDDGRGVRAAAEVDQRRGIFGPAGGCESDSGTKFHGTRNLCRTSEAGLAWTGGCRLLLHHSGRFYCFSDC